ncbi:MAG: PH domain-containing protein [Solirubrobacterales bacterium]
MELERLDEKAKKSWMISRVIALIIVTAVLITLRLIFAGIIGNKAIIINIVILIIIVFMGINAFIYPKLEYSQWQYSITEDSIEFIHGIFFIKHTIIPIIRIQHIKTSQGPINRKFDLSNLEIYTAGGMHEIPNLNKEKAEKISDYIKDKVHIKVTEERKGSEL